MVLFLQRLENALLNMWKTQIYAGFLIVMYNFCGFLQRRENECSLSFFNVVMSNNNIVPLLICFWSLKKAIFITVKMKSFGSET